jgi:hypothetical protein
MKSGESERPITSTWQTLLTCKKEKEKNYGRFKVCSLQVQGNVPGHKLRKIDCRIQTNVS